MSSKLQNYLTFLLILLAGVLVWQGVLPTISRLQVAQEQLTQRQNEVALLQQLINQSQQMFNQLPKTQAELLNQAIPKQLNLSDTVEMVRALAQTSGLVVSSVTVLPQAAAANQTNQPKEGAANQGQAPVSASAAIELSLQGSYQGLRTLTRLIETNLPLLDIDELRVSAAGQGEQLKFDLKLVSYYLE